MPPACIKADGLQGWMIGPKHFLMFVDNLAHSMCSPCYLFADDVKVPVIELDEDVKRVKVLSRR